jgi:hypothetical protein
MTERLSRKELYDLVWSEPLKTLCSRFGISDAALKKTCARAEIPTPGDGAMLTTKWRWVQSRANCSMRLIPDIREKYREFS